MSVRRSLLAALVAAAVMGGLGFGSRAPWRAGDERAAIRLAWRARGEKVEECRPLSAEEQAELPVHMRRTEVCEGRLRPYLLSVRIDGRTSVADTVVGAGVREDRPIHVSRELRVAPGGHAIEVVFQGLGEGRRAGALSLSTRVRLEPREVALVTYDPGRDALVVRTPEGPVPGTPPSNIED